MAREFPTMISTLLDLLLTPAKAYCLQLRCRHVKRGNRIKSKINDTIPETPWDLGTRGAYKTFCGRKREGGPTDETNSPVLFRAGFPPIRVFLFEHWRSSEVLEKNTTFHDNIQPISFFFVYLSHDSASHFST